LQVVVDWRTLDSNQDVGGLSSLFLRQVAR